MCRVRGHEESVPSRHCDFLEPAGNGRSGTRVLRIHYQCWSRRGKTSMPQHTSRRSLAPLPVEPERTRKARHPGPDSPGAEIRTERSPADWRRRSRQLLWRRIGEPRRWCPANFARNLHMHTSLAVSWLELACRETLPSRPILFSVYLLWLAVVRSGSSDRKCCRGLLGDTFRQQ